MIWAKHEYHQQEPPSDFSCSATSTSISRRLSKRNALSSLSSSSAASASSHFSRKSSRRFAWSVLITAPGALGMVVRSEESPDGGGSVNSIARNSRVSANVSKLHAIMSRQYSRIFATPYLRVQCNHKLCSRPISYSMIYSSMIHSISFLTLYKAIIHKGSSLLSNCWASYDHTPDFTCLNHQPTGTMKTMRWDDKHDRAWHIQQVKLW